MRQAHFWWGEPQPTQINENLVDSVLMTLVPSEYTIWTLFSKAPGEGLTPRMSIHVLGAFSWVFQGTGISDFLQDPGTQLWNEYH